MPRPTGRLSNIMKRNKTTTDYAQERREQGLCAECLTPSGDSYRCEYHSEKHKEYGSEYVRRLKDKIFAVYGDSCICCGEDERVFLQVDHIDGGGNTHRKEVTGEKQGGFPFYLWIIKNDFPAGFQILCANCNVAKAILGVCPHKLE